MGSTLLTISFLDIKETGAILRGYFVTILLFYYFPPNKESDRLY